MRAAVFTEPGQPLSVETVSDPEPGPTDIVMKVHACGVCGSDLHMTEDHGPGFSFAPGDIPGHEYAGEIAEVGKDVTRFKAGDRIAALPYTGCGRCRSCLSGEPSHCPEFRGLGSGYSEYALVSEFTAVRLGDGLDFDSAALVEPLAVGLHGVVAAGVTVGDSVLVMGAGPIGLAAAFFARRMGAGRVAVSATSRRREDYARAFGADFFIAPEKDQPLADAVAGSMGALPDIVLECAGKTGCVDAAIQAVRPKGTVVILGFCTSPDPIIPAIAMWKEVTLKGSNTYTIGEFAHVAELLALGEDQPRKMITRRINLDEVPEVFESLRGPNDQCKVLINPWA